MRLDEIARAILFGDRWEDKLAFDSGFEDEGVGPALPPIPDFPGRPVHLKRIGKAEFPKLHLLKEDATRGQILHFFANHELLAMELMALMLLKFPDAPKPFRAGVARTIAEEQSHLRLYVERMQELGVGFGELPMSDYFWNAMKGMKSPLEFVVQMSLTLEQANLDYSLYYQKAVAEVGDGKTAAILEKVFREEIGHVKHGVAWFNRWRGENIGRAGSAGLILPEDDWDAYLRLLPPPMTPRRAKGLGFSAESRREAGLSERFIRELEVHTGSRGRPPVFWLYNPLCDAEIARGRAGLSASDSVKRFNLDLEHLPMFLALEQDVVWVENPPRAEWLKDLGSAGLRIPEFRKVGENGAFPSVSEAKIGGLEPWGWSPEPFAKFKPWRERLLPLDGANGGWCGHLLQKESFAATGFGAYFSKAWSVAFLRRWLEENPQDRPLFGELVRVGEVFQDWAKARDRLERGLASGEALLAKAPWGTSGTQNRRVLAAAELDGPLGGWIRNTIESQGAIVVEPWLEKVADLSIQLVVQPSGVKLLGIRQFVNGARLEYRGTHLDPKLGSLDPALLRFLHSAQGPLDRWRALARALGEELRAGGYEGPAGIDALIYSDSTGIRLKPLVELNPRWTMGRVALELEEHVLPASRATWVFLPLRELETRGLPKDASEAAAVLRERHPLRVDSASGSPRIAEGVVFTSDPARAREVLTVLAVGPRAFQDPSLRFRL